MRHESKRWNPAHWSEEKRRRFTKHSLFAARSALNELVGGYETALIVGELRASLQGARSQFLIHQAGMKTLGDTEPTS